MDSRFAHRIIFQTAAHFEQAQQRQTAFGELVKGIVLRPFEPAPQRHDVHGSRIADGGGDIEPVERLAAIEVDRDVAGRRR